MLDERVGALPHLRFLEAQARHIGYELLQAPEPTDPLTPGLSGLGEEPENLSEQKQIPGKTFGRHRKYVPHKSGFLAVHAVVRTHEDLYQHVVLDVGLAAGPNGDDPIRIEMAGREHAGKHA